MAKVEVQFAHPYKSHQPGSVASLDEHEAARLVEAGYAVPAKVSDAKAVGASPDDAASKR